MEPAALRAQAVAARTYAAFDARAQTTRYYDTCDTTSCQVYGGFGDEDTRVNAAVDATAGNILNNGGQTCVHPVRLEQRRLDLGRSMPYLLAKADPYDGFSGNPVHTWSTRRDQGGRSRGPARRSGR